MKHFSLTAYVSTSDKGYTLIEVLIAVAIFSIGLMAMSALQIASLKSTGNIAAKTQALAILADRTETLKSMPFYITINGIDKNKDGAIDTATSGAAELTAGNHTENRLNGQYTVYWQVADNQPIPAVSVPPAAANDPVLPEVPAGTYTVSKTISVQVTLAGDNPRTDALATVQFVKTWAKDGIP